MNEPVQQLHLSPQTDAVEGVSTAARRSATLRPASSAAAAAAAAALVLPGALMSGLPADATHAPMIPQWVL